MTREQTMPRIAVLGMGLLGTGFAEGLLSRGGAQVVVWNRTRAKADALAPLGAIVAETAAEAVQGADRVHLVLLDDDVVDATLAECLQTIGPDTVIVDHTTTLPLRTAERAASLDAAGRHYLHAPVMMGPAAARDAKGIMLVAGPSTRFARVRADLAVMTGELWHVGERPDLAAVYKLFGNATILSLVGVQADVMHLADATGVTRDGALQMLSKLTISAHGGIRGQMMTTDTYAPPSFTLEVARKDLRLMLATAGTEPVPMLHALAGRMDTMLAAGEGAKDVSVLAKRGP